MKQNSKCWCDKWRRTNQKIHTRHHRYCPRYDPEGDAREIIMALIRGIDGMDVHAAYRRAAAFVWRDLG